MISTYLLTYIVNYVKFNHKCISDWNLHLENDRRGCASLEETGT